MPDLTISMTGPQATRVAAAIGDALRLDQPATMAEAKAYLIQKLKSLTLSYERRLAESAVAKPDPLDLT